jgi:aminoglycoside 2'-N-acetyltransferase I
VTTQSPVRRVATVDLTVAEVAAIRDLLWEAFGQGEDGMTEEDWQHALGGTHFLLEVDDRIVAHAAVVEREIHVGDRALRAGYVEAVATASEHQGAGLGSRLMADVGAHIRDRYELGVLGTGRHRFYERLGWTTWAGPLYVRTPDGPRRTPDEEGFLLVLETPASPPLDLAAPISCAWRDGDVW